MRANPNAAAEPHHVGTGGFAQMKKRVLKMHGHVAIKEHVGSTNTDNDGEQSRKYIPRDEWQFADCG